MSECDGEKSPSDVVRYVVVVSAVDVIAVVVVAAAAVVVVVAPHCFDCFDLVVRCPL